jgi:hypothetical protein
LARKIAAVTGSRDAASLTVRNVSSLSEEEASEVLGALEGELRGKDVSLVEHAAAATHIAVTLSENASDCVWTAEIMRGAQRDVVIVSRPRVAADPGANSRVPLVIEKRNLWEQADPMLDVAQIPGALLVLGVSSVSMYTRRSDRWELARSLAIPDSAPWPRDIRGRLEMEGDSFHAYLPGVVCLGKTRPEFWMDCGPGDGRWPLGSGNAMLAEGRNFLEGRFAKELPPFFSAAQVADRGNPLLILAGLDGRARIYDQTFQPAGSIEGWGSDIAAVSSKCGNGRQVLASRSAASDEPDAIQAYEISGRKPIAVSAPLAFLGSVSALWTAPGDETAVAITRDLRTGRYAAFSLSIFCGN